MRVARHILTGVLLGVCVVSVASPAFAATRVVYVDARGAVSGDGTSWDNAYPCLHSALSAAPAGGEIWVAQGTYRPDLKIVYRNPRRGNSTTELVASGDRSESFALKEGVVVKGGYAGSGAPDPNARDIDAYESILSGDLAGNDVQLKNLDWQSLADYTSDPTLADNSYNVVYADRTDNSAVLDGFTIMGGYADWEPQGGPGPTDTDSVPSPRSQMDGAGAFLFYASPTFVRCTFYRNVVRPAPGDLRGGAGVAFVSSHPVFRECVFTQNIVFSEGGVSFGGAILSVGGELTFWHSNPVLTNCTFTENVVAGPEGAHAGGAIAVFHGRPELTNCSFTGNRALQSNGGAIFNGAGATSVFTDCTFERNAAQLGGAAYNGTEDPRFVGCAFLYNEATEAGQGGALYNDTIHHGRISKCRFVGNRADVEGGAIFSGGTPTIDNCLFLGNSARRGGALLAERGGDLTLHNCTASGNQALERGGTLYSRNGTRDIRNCIFWGGLPNEIHMMEIAATISYSDIQGGNEPLGDIGNIIADPQFRDPAGPDGVVGTPDDDLRLTAASPCLDAGDNAAVPAGATTDLDGNPRIAGGRVDMGAYEFHGPFNFYVDAVNGDDTNSGASPGRAFATIQRGVDAAGEGYSVVVLPGLYTEEIDFMGKAITVMGADHPPILEAPGDYAASFYSAEGPASILRNVVIQDSDVGIFIAGSSPTIWNVTLANNEFGIAAYAGASPDIRNCILWGNTEGDLFGCTAHFSCVERGAQGEGNISVDPLFGDGAAGDYHLLSEKGRYVSAYKLWSFDAQSSPCVDAGDPDFDPAAERLPNGGRINMGAFGGTSAASMSDWPLAADLDRDGIVDLGDLAILCSQWLQELPWHAPTPPR